MYNGMIIVLILCVFGLVIGGIWAICDWVYEKVDDAWQEHMRKVNSQKRG